MAGPTNRFFERVSEGGGGMLDLFALMLRDAGVVVFESSQRYALLAVVGGPTGRFNVVATVDSQDSDTLVVEADSGINVPEEGATLKQVLRVLVDASAPLRLEVLREKSTGAVATRAQLSTAARLVHENPDELVSWFREFVGESETLISTFRRSLMPHVFPDADEQRDAA